MTTRRVRGLMPTAALLLCLVALPVLAAPATPNSPPYTSPQQIQVAQRILESERYLKAGHYAHGDMDPNTIAALRAFQYDHFIPNNGVLDQDTMATLTTHRPAAPTQMARNNAGMAQGAGDGSSTAAAGSGSSASDRTMPTTASPVPAMAGLGALLIGMGVVVLRWKRV